MAVDKRHLIDNERLADYSKEVKKTFVKQTVTVAGKPLSADVVLDKLTVSGKFSDITGSQYDGSGVVSIYSPDQNVSVGSTPTFKTVTVTDGITGDVTSAQKVDHSLLVTHSALDIGEKSFDGSATVNIYSPDQNVNDGSSPTFATVTGDIFKGALRGNADTATDFEASKSITLSGDVSGSGSGGNGTGWQLTNMSIGTGKVLNTMLAHSTIGIGNLTMSLGDSTTTLAGMDSITSTSFVGTLTGNSSNVNDIVAILHGGTGASTVAGALANLGLTYTFLYKGEYSGDANLTTIPVGYYHVSGVTTINHFPVDGMYGTFIQYDGGYHTQELIADSDGYTRKVYIRRYDTTTSAWLGWYDVSRGDVYGVKGSNETAYRVGQVSISKADVGLSNADNTADSVKHVLYSDSAGKTTYTLSVVNGASDKGSAGSFNGSSAFTVYTPNQNVNLNSSPTFATLTATSYLGTWDGNVLASVKIPTATASVKGGVVIGTGLGVKSDGTLSVTYGTVSGTAYEGDKGNALAVKLTNVSYASATDTTTVTDPVVLSGTVSMTGSSISMGVTPKVNGVAVSLVGHTHVLTDVTDITATASEVNTLHGITSSTAELNVLHGITSSTAELNKLTGLTPTTTELNYVDGVTSSIQTQLDTLDSKKVNVSLLGVANGVATLDSEGTVPASQLPSYVDDILEGYYGDSTHFYKDSAKTVAYTPETGKIYVDVSTDTAYSGKTYRWSGTQYSVVSESLALGETSSTAYRGDRGKIAYDHSLIVSGNPHKVTKAEVGLGNADNTADSVKVVLSATGFTTAKAIALTGNVTGSATGGESTNGWSIATTISAGAVTNSMLAGSVTNAKLVNSSLTVGTTTIALGGSSTTLVGLDSVTSTLFTGALTGTATRATADASGNVITTTYATKVELASDVDTLNASIALKLDKSLKGVANGLAELDKDGKVPSAQLPSYVDDILEFATKSDFPTTGETGKIYVALDTNLTYRWSGTTYIEVSQSLALGETSSTAYRGDRGKIAYDHTFLTDNPHEVTKAQVGLGNADNTADAVKVVLSATGFTTAKSIALTGNVTGSATGGDSTNGWSIATVITDGAVTNAMLAGSIANAKLVNSSLKVGTTSIALGGASTVLAGLTSVTSTLFTGALTGTATNATKDASGNVITSTYATNTELATDVDTLNASIATKVSSSLLGIANGVATLDSDAKVPASQLPSFVDDILEFDTKSDFPTTGESGKIYVALDTNLTYRWSGTTYIEVSQSLALGETSSTAYRGDRGKIAYDHTFLTTNPHSVTKAQVGLGNADNTADSVKVVLSATGFTMAKSIALTGNVTGSATGGDSTNGWSIATVISAGAVTNSMLAGSITNAKLVNSSLTVGTTTISLGGSSTTLAGLTNVSSALFTGVATQVRTVTNADNATYYLTFVDSDNATSAGESLYTGLVKYNPYTNALTTTVSNISGTASVATTSSHVWFSDSTTETARASDDDFKYTPSTNVLTVGSITGTASALTTARKIAGVSFNGTADIFIPFANLSSIPTTVAGYGITDAVTLAGNQTIAGTKTFSSTISGSVSGNSGTATALQTARKIAGVSFNGTADIAIPFANLSSIPTTVNGYGITDAVTLAGNQTIAGVKTFSSTITGSVSGNSGTATALQTARTIAGVSFNGTANIAIPFANLSSIPTTVSGYGITDAITTHGGQTIAGTLTVSDTLSTHALLPVDNGLSDIGSTSKLYDGIYANTGDFTNSITVPTVNGNLNGVALHVASTYGVLTISTTALAEDATFNGAEGNNVSVYSPAQLVNPTSNVTFNLVTASTVTANLTGNATSADKVNHTLTITTTPTILSSTFNGSANATVYTPDQSVNSGSSPTFDAITGTSFSGNSATATKVNHTLTTVRIPTTIASYDGSEAQTIYSPGQGLETTDTVTFAGITSEVIVGKVTGNADSASKVLHPLVMTTNTVTGADTFDGSVSKSVYTPDQSVNNGASPTFTTVTANLTGTASNASKVTNALTFTTSGPTATGTYNGSAVKSVYSPDQSVNIGDNVTFGTVTAKLMGDVTGNASTATALQTARTINGTSFDGSVNITTSSWGTARTLYVKDSASQYTGSGVSVNGGSDATLVLPSIVYAKSFTGNDNRFNHDLAYYGGGRISTGAIVITLPNAWTDTMMSFEIGVYQYDSIGGSRILVSGYNFNDTNWYNYRTSIEGSYTNGVMLGYNGSKCCIILGDVTTVWTYPQVHLLNVTTGASSPTAWRTGYSISLVTDLSGYSKLVTPALSDSHAKTVTANTFYGSLSGTAQTTAKVDTVASTSSGTFYPTFVDSNNSASVSELVYTSGGVSYVPSTGTLASTVVSSPKVIGTAVQTGRVVIKGTVESPTAYMEYDDASSAIVFNVA